jgi:[protein-PII] uridylyltransferase
VTARCGPCRSKASRAFARERPVPTPSESAPKEISTRLREARAALLADTTRRGRAWGEALAAEIDRALIDVFATFSANDNVAVVALGSYGRREMCPGSDVDVLLVHSFKGRSATETVREMAERLWYPLWDAGFVTGHGARTVKESVALADSDLDALTALLDVRVVAGDAALANKLQSAARDLAVRRRDRVLRALADAAEVRNLRPGPVAEMLEADLKDGAGGLRDVQSLDWAGWTLGAPGSTDALVTRGYLMPSDLHRVDEGRELLLDVRVSLQRLTNARTDRLALQEQDAVASDLGFADADVLVHDLSASAREIAWVTRDVWSRVRDMLAGPSGRTGRGDELLAEHVVLRDGRVHVESDADGTMPALRVLEAAVAAAERDASFERASLERLRQMRAPEWDVWERAAFLRLLRQGGRAVPVFEALDHEGVLTQILPEWEHVRSRPQRNAYHRFTVDRHLLEAVAECAQLLDTGDQAKIAPGDVDAVVARACRRPELLLLSALLHDIAKGQPGDHSEVGAQTAATIARRIGLDSEGREILVWLVRNHLLMAEVATRRDLSDASVADGVAAACAGDAERLRLLYLLTIGDSHATGPAAWSPSKASLVRDLFVKAAAAIERGEARAVANDRREALAEKIGTENAAELLARLPESYVLAFAPEEMASHLDLLRVKDAVRCEPSADTVTITVVTADRAGLLATLAGALTVCGLDVLEANVFGTTDGRALDVFRAGDPFGRTHDDASRVVETIERALRDEIDLTGRVDERRRAYSLRSTSTGAVRIELDGETSETDSIVEVHADDEVGLLYRLASAFADLALDVRVAKVATQGARVVDVFYVRDARGQKIGVADAERVRAVLAEHIAR